MSDTAIAILAGGQSRRMGQDKASLQREGVTLLARTARLAATVVGASRVVVVGREQPQDGAFDDATTFLVDEHPGDGPLAAIGLALRWAETCGCDRIAVLACDLPLLTEEAVRWLVATGGEMATGDGVAVVGSDGRIEPLFSVYSVRCQTLLVAQLATGRRSPTAMIERENFGRVIAPDFVQAAIKDVDTPEAWEAIMAASETEPVT